MGITKYTRWQLAQTTTVSRVGPEADPERPCKATGLPQTQCHAAELPKTLARSGARFITRNGIERGFGSVVVTIYPDLPRNQK